MGKSVLDTAVDDLSPRTRLSAQPFDAFSTMFRVTSILDLGALMLLTAVAM